VDGFLTAANSLRPSKIVDIAPHVCLEFPPRAPGSLRVSARIRGGTGRAELAPVPERFAPYEVVARLFGERAVSARACHPGLVEIRAAGRSADDVPYLVMEYLEGTNLADVLTT